MTDLSAQIENIGEWVRFVDSIKFRVGGMVFACIDDNKPFSKSLNRYYIGDSVFVSLRDAKKVALQIAIAEMRNQGFLKNDIIDSELLPRDPGPSFTGEFSGRERRS